jgi:nucleoside-diphosphate-sugar epimerase
LKKQIVLLLGASGSMGSAAFKELWSRKDANGERKYDVVLLQRPSKVNKEMFAPYEAECGIQSIPGKGIVQGKGLKIVWGDATVYEDMVEAVKGVDWVLCPMAFISPEADHKPAMAKAVNTTAIEYVIKAIEAQPGGADHIKFIYTGSVAETGDRLPPIHLGRVGDPLKPSIFDFYATTKIAGERAVLESNLKYWASLRQTFIMIPDVFSLQDPIMFHQPINSFMENNTMEDAGRGLINCLDVPEDSTFWRRAYNMGGGPNCRITFADFMQLTFGMLGMDIRRICDRNWFALRNFHMQYFMDSADLDQYIHNFGETTEDYLRKIWENMPTALKIVAKINKVFPPMRWMVEKATRSRLKKLAMQKDGTLYWYHNKNDMRITAFYGSYEKFEKIPDWKTDLPGGVFGMPEPEGHLLDHGYDEKKAKLDLGDLKGAAKFRGGECLSTSWNGDLYTKVSWKCAFDHKFDAKPYTVLKAGHWCPKCAAPPWNYDEIAKKNPFFAQVWYPNHDKDEHNFYPEDCYKDIAD